MSKVKRNDFAKNRGGFIKNHISFTKVMFASVLIFALSFTAWISFRATPANFAKAVDSPTETIRAITADDGDPYIQFNTRGGYINTGENQLGDIRAEIDF